MTAPKLWVAGARPRTLGASVVPVLVGLGAAHHIIWWRAALTMIVALGLQVGVNYANDYFDGVKGVDTAQRAGPTRLTATGLAAPRKVLGAAFIALLSAAVAGGLLALLVSPWFFLIGAVALLASMTYSGGPKPYASLGFGEVFVFVFFGPVAVCGAAFAQLHVVPRAAWWASIPVGLLAVAILVANNLRDIPTDSATGKRTLAVRLGDARTRALYRIVVAVSFVVVAFAVLVHGLPREALLAVAAVPFAIKPLRVVASARGPALVPVLIGTALLHVVFGALLSAGLWLA